MRLVCLYVLCDEIVLLVRRISRASARLRWRYVLERLADGSIARKCERCGFDIGCPV